MRIPGKSVFPIRCGFPVGNRARRSLTILLTILSNSGEPDARTGGTETPGSFFRKGVQNDFIVARNGAAL